MTKAVKWAGLIFAALGIVGCATTPASFLRAATDRVTQEDVGAQLGPPHEVWALATGDTLWTYRTDERLWAYWNGTSAGGRAGGVSIVGPGLVLLPGTRCTAYVLRFDGTKVLRAWRQQPCQRYDTKE